MFPGPVGQVFSVTFLRPIMRGVKGVLLGHRLEK